MITRGVHVRLFSAAGCRVALLTINRVRIDNGALRTVKVISMAQDFNLEASHILYGFILVIIKGQF